MELTEAERLRLEDLAIMAKARSDARSIVYLVDKFRRQYGSNFSYLSAIEEKARTIDKSISSSSK